jgi:hypothetical protein
MKKRSPIAVFLLGLITIGFYSWYWAVKTKGEMNRLGEKIPTAWIWLIPIVGSIWWYWKYSEGVEHITHETINRILAFVVLYLLGSIGQAILQDSFNKIDSSQATDPISTTTVQPASIVIANQSSVQPTPPDQQPPTITPSIPPIVGM